MACSIQGLVTLSFSGIRWRRSSHSSGTIFPENGRKIFCGGKIGRKVRKNGIFKAMVQQALQGASASYAKEMERLSAKESLLLAFKDSGGFEALVTGKTTEMQRIDVNERIIDLERLNPTTRPTTYPGQAFLKVGGILSGLELEVQNSLLLDSYFSESFPSTLANLSKVDLVIKDQYAKITAIMRLLNSIESKFTVSTQLSVEGPLRMKEEYVEGVLELPQVDEATIPEQLRDAFGQAASTAQQLPVPIRDAMASGLKVPLGCMCRMFFFVLTYGEESDDKIIKRLSKVGLSGEYL
ncbi:probable plastid-lipid-associated protein 13, chloroplastic isoform X3 [Actinidia eriantha]|uniref:probable plastid-lipid-associated protein 13, chloroplastic isoform X3 n=1 Tax=Actinidia eriantha TaxID=165200 RepID=UPI00258951DD|nr:probable plastid-lipid-associated protein 13, chloroplastic isoform X3 [Actinidia eriantha]